MCATTREPQPKIIWEGPGNKGTPARIVRTYRGDPPETVYVLEILRGNDAMGQPSWDWDGEDDFPVPLRFYEEAEAAFQALAQLQSGVGPPIPCK